ncbi:MAG: lycopene cyclase [Chitinophagaceae bacterium]|nr:lycopene cyclase [Chitinophagaceae bacterium]MCA6470037.1 lycopene cyclase [Chitinophagaceae bacterium]MCA6478709.1 lycopene cyclase [Chitinophagaceae bacterium]MCA6492920.1 lycopene cyclase [Chitinophagaceae bacterium]MCA6498524.1 lycopene cyclase [Chitinophagaceae bacterium]
MKERYDYIISGAGCAGMSVLVRMLEDPFFEGKKILVLDAAEKNTNDRTWCFWEKGNGVFESIVSHAWSRLNFFSADYATNRELAPYRYKMIRGIDLYDFVKEKAVQHPGVTWLKERVPAIVPETDGAAIELSDRNVTAPVIINSIVWEDTRDLAKAAGAHHLLQHFKGWLIQTEEDCFDPTTATFMDFRVSQDAGTAFVYVLPTSPREALVEYTLFTADLLPQEAYDLALQDYITKYITGKSYKTLHTEWGVIPMTNLQFPKRRGAVVNIGLAGGQVKASSGFAFQFIQRRAEALVASLKSGDTTCHRDTLQDKKFRLFDGVLLQILSTGQLGGDRIFTDLFQKNDVQRIFRFLDNETGLVDDLRIMWSVPTGIFLPAALRELRG